ncbi:unnamed protein product [Adineta ricciae]|uniref:G-protein coupled receptors family 1 profile domain-containing protein n=1 Tax=Adineta ricciae TaxID=249248 RepID=A0A814SW00_ADIRI|nr:unnamed protein product [Adineta ricciae]CAF1473739.1 unnamed protein product [Adineta ricciae]
MSDSMYNLAVSIYFATIHIAEIIPPIQIAFGTLGNVLNIILFTRPNLRTNPCSMYFLVGSINNFSFIYLFSLTDYLSSVWNINIPQNTQLLCKLITFIRLIPFSLLLWFPVLASIDRFLSSSSRTEYRRLSSLSVAKRVTISIYLFFLLLHIHILIFFEMVPYFNDYTCSISSYEYYTFYNFFESFLVCIVPIVLMCIFGVLIILNVRSTRNRVVPNGDNVRIERIRSQDRQMVRMLLSQILITFIISLPYVATILYYTLAIVTFKYEFSLVESMIYQLASLLANYFYQTNFAIGFYIYTLTSGKFRTELKHCLLNGLNIVLTKLGVQRFIPMRMHQGLQNSTIWLANFSNGRGGAGPVYLVGRYGKQPVYRTSNAVVSYLKNQQYENKFTIFSDLWIPQCDILQTDFLIRDTVPAFVPYMDNVAQENASNAADSNKNINHYPSSHTPTLNDAQTSLKNKHIS